MLTVHSRKIYIVPVCSSPPAIENIRPCSAMNYELDFGRVLDATGVSCKIKNILPKEIYYCIFYIRFKGYILWKFKTSQILYFLYNLCVIFTGRDFDVSVCQPTKYLHFLTPVIKHRVMLYSLMHSHWNWHRWYKVYWHLHHFRCISASLGIYFVVLIAILCLSWQQLSHLCSHHCLIQLINRNRWSVQSLTHKYYKSFVTAPWQYPNNDIKMYFY